DSGLDGALVGLGAAAGSALQPAEDVHHPPQPAGLPHPAPADLADHRQGYEALEGLRHLLCDHHAGGLLDDDRGPGRADHLLAERSVARWAEYLPPEAVQLPSLR